MNIHIVREKVYRCLHFLIEMSEKVQVAVNGGDGGDQRITGGPLPLNYLPGGKKRVKMANLRVVDSPLPLKYQIRSISDPPVSSQRVISGSREHERVVKPIVAPVISLGEPLPLDYLPRRREEVNLRERVKAKLHRQQQIIPKINIAEIEEDRDHGSVIEVTGASAGGMGREEDEVNDISAVLTRLKSLEGRMNELESATNGKGQRIAMGVLIALVLTGISLLIAD